MSLVLKLEKEGGFCWQMWCIAEHYIEAERNGLTFYIDDSDYLFKNNRGWRDYFTSLHIYDSSLALETPIITRSNLSFYDPSIKDRFFTLNELNASLEKIFLLTTELSDKLEKTYDRLSLTKGEYGACMIRRGDKMFGESDFIPLSSYLVNLIEMGIDTIYIQTDDYKVYQEAISYVKANYPEKDLKLLTLCPEWKQGTICYNIEYNNINTNRENARNQGYVDTLLSRFKKTVEEYTPHEMKEHVEEMIIGFDICIHSKYLVLDLQSNVTRMLYTRHPRPDDVMILHANRPSFDIPYMSPRLGFISELEYLNPNTSSLGVVE